MSKPGRAWLVREENLRLQMGGDDLADSFVVIDEERVAFRVAQATLGLREELAEARDFLKSHEDEWKIDPVAFDLLDKRATRYERAIERLKAQLRELGFTVGRNPDGVDDTVEATLLIVAELWEENQRLALENAELRGASV